MSEQRDVWYWIIVAVLLAAIAWLVVMIPTMRNP